MNERLAEIERTWTTNYDRGAHDYTDAGCRLLAEHGFRDVAWLLALVRDLERINEFDRVVPIQELREELERAQADAERLRAIVEIVQRRRARFADDSQFGHPHSPEELELDALLAGVRVPGETP